jgi:AAA+ ATPase superfamily predicted ATPase
MHFVDRQLELERLERLLTRGDEAALGVLWGRRRVGKTRLLLEWVRKHQGIYWVADESSAAVQRRYLALALAERFQGFAAVEYPDWESLLSRLAREAAAQSWRGPLVIDELPYLVASDPAFASVLQRFVDHHSPRAGLVVAVAGSSQRMMQGAALAPSAPLYGRAAELMRLGPLPAGYLGQALRLGSPRQTITAYALWGGVPRYWELAAPFGEQIEEAACQLVLDPLGPLHEEPQRLLLEELPPATSLRPILDAIGMGAHRLSDIASRTGQPVTSITRPMARLQELGLVRREVPFGQGERQGKRALYKLADPFLRLWFRAVAPRRGVLAQSRASWRRKVLRGLLPALVAETWEELCRAATVALAHPSGVTFGPGGRYWHGQGPEWDLLAEGIEAPQFLIGEAKWSAKGPTGRFMERTASQLLAKGHPPVCRLAGSQVHYTLFVPERPDHSPDLPAGMVVYTAKDVLAALH